jgi:hypothetical protein
MKRERNGERKERRNTDRKDIFKFNNITKRCAKWREVMRERGKESE